MRIKFALVAPLNLTNTHAKLFPKLKANEISTDEDTPSVQSKWAATPNDPASHADVAMAQAKYPTRLESAERGPEPSIAGSDTTCCYGPLVEAGLHG